MFKIQEKKVRKLSKKNKKESSVEPGRITLKHYKSFPYSSSRHLHVILKFTRFLKK